MNQFFGKYRGKVVDNTDPQGRGRLKVRVPDVLGDDRESWALPCVPYAGPGAGFFAIPPVDANLWVEFECGDPSSPIWSGCFWDQGQAPDPAGDARKKIFKTDAGTITIDESAGGGSLTIETSQGAKIILNDAGIELNNGSGATIKLSANQVSINDGALEVS